MTTRIHRPCGKPMLESLFGHNDRNPAYRSQPVWLCTPCNAWEPRDGWDGPLPDGWDGRAWTEES